MQRTFLRFMALGSLAAVATFSAALVLPDAQVVIDRTANNRSLSVRYSGAAVKMVELRINGESVMTRTVSDDSSAGEATFELNPAKLQDGNNRVEIRLYDADGKVVGSGNSTITVDRSATGPVFIAKPMRGSQLQGQVEIQIGFEVELKGVYVSFFVNDEFKSLRNSAPYRFLWDTTQVRNGWHEVQAWVVDSNNNTFKTERVRVFVNNPGGRTDRQDTAPADNISINVNGNSVESLSALYTPTVARPASTKPATATTGRAAERILLPTGQRPLRPVTATTASAPTAQPTRPILPPVNPEETKPTEVKPEDVKPIETPAETKPVEAPAETKPLVEIKPSETNALVPPGDIFQSANVVRIQAGTRVPNIGEYTIALNGRNVNFDVAPRVVDGIPLTPFRHLVEASGGSVAWENNRKVVEAIASGQNVWFQIGVNTARINGEDIVMERAPFIDRGRSIVPLSFMHYALRMDFEMDIATKHVLVRPIVAQDNRP